MSIEKYYKFISEQAKNIKVRFPCPDKESRPGVECSANLSDLEKDFPRQEISTDSKSMPPLETASVKYKIPPKYVHMRPYKGPDTANTTTDLGKAKSLGWSEKGIVASSIKVKDGILPVSNNTESPKPERKEPKIEVLKVKTNPVLNAPSKVETGSTEKPDGDPFNSTKTMKTIDGSIGRAAENHFLSKNDVGAVQRAKAIAIHAAQDAPEAKTAPEEKPKTVAPEPETSAPEQEAPSTPERKTTKRERVISGAKERLTRSQRMSKAMHSGDLQGVVSGTYGESTEIK